MVTPNVVIGGTTVLVTITLDGPPPPEGAVVALRSSSSAVRIPDSVTLRTQDFINLGIGTTNVLTPQTVTITASYGGVTKMATLTVNPNISGPNLRDFTIVPNVVSGGTTVLGTVTLDGLAPAAGVVISLSSNNSAAQVPNTVTIDAGQSFIRIGIGTTNVATSQTVTITAVYAGVTKTATFTVNPASQLILDQVNSPTWTGGWTVIGKGNPNRLSQSFVPALPKLLAVDVDILTGNPGRGGDTLTLKIASQSGEVLGSVSQGVQDGFDGNIRFTFPSDGIEVSPGRTHIIQLEDSGREIFGWRYGANTYPNGVALFNGQPWNSGLFDFFFKTYGQGQRPLNNPDLIVNKVSSPNPVSSGGTITYTLTVQNIGGSDAQNVNLTDPLPAGVAFVSCRASIGSCNGVAGTVTAQLGTLSANASAVVTVLVTAPTVAGQTVITNSARVSTTSTESNSANNQTSQTTTVNPPSACVTGPSVSGGTVLSLAIDPTNSNTIYAGASGWGAFKTVNGSQSWSVINSGLSVSDLEGSPQAWAVDPANPRTIYAGTFNRGIFKSTDAGQNWTPINVGLTNLDVRALVIDRINPNVVYAGTFAGVLKTTNGGQSWTAMNSGIVGSSFGIQVLALAIDRNNTATIYAGVAGGGVFKSTDSGQTWAFTSSGLSNTEIRALFVDPSNSATLYTGTLNGIFKSTNGAQSWTVASSGITSASINTIVVSPESSAVLYAGTGGGVFKSTDGGQSWVSASCGITPIVAGPGILALAIDPGGTLYAGTLGGGVFKSINGGTSWTAVNSGLVEPAQATSPDLTITKTASPNPVTSSGILTYTISVENIGSVSAASAIVTDTLPTNVTFQSCSLGSCSVSGNAVTASLGTISAGASTTFNITVIAPIVASAISITNTARVSTTSSELNTANNQASQTTTVSPSASPVIPITSGQIVNGSLTSASARSVGCGGCYADLYQFTIDVPAPPNGFHALILRSTAFNAFLRLLDTSGQTIATDDNGFGGTDALIRRSIGPGTYRIEVTTLTPGATGSYTLELRLVTISASSISVGQTVNGTLNVLSAFATSCSGCYVDYWDFTILSPQTLTLSVNSTAFDAYLRVLDGSLNPLASDDDSGGGTNSRLVYTFPRGSYRIEATTARPGAIGPYTLSLQSAPAPDLTITKTASPSPVTSGGTLTYNITIQNIGTGNAGSLTVTDTLPATVVFQSCSVPCTRSGNVVTVNMASLASGSSTSFNIVVTAPTVTNSTSIVNTAGVVTPGDSNPANNQDSQTSTVTPPTTIPISTGQTVTGNLTLSSGRSIVCTGCYTDLYQFTLTTPTPPGSPIVVLMQSSSFNAYLRLLDSSGTVLSTDDNSGGGTNALIRRELGAGTYRIEATTLQPATGGSYSLAVRIAQIVSGEISVGQSINGTLTQFTGASSRCNYCYADYYDIQLSAAQSVVISLSSSSFDTYLRLFDRNLNVLASDDNGGGGTNSRIATGLQPGFSRIEISAAAVGGSGSYTISVQPAAPVVTQNVLPYTTSSTLDTSSSRSGVCSTCYANLYEFTLSAPTTPGLPVVIFMQSTSVNAYLRLLDRSGAVLATDDNSGGGTNALIREGLGAGTYRVEATTRDSNRGGAYTLNIQLAILTYQIVTLPYSASPTLTVFATATSRCANCYGDFVDFYLSATTTVTITLSSGAFDPYLRLFDGNLIFLTSDDNSGGGTTARISRSLTSGWYRVECSPSAMGGAGVYTLRIQ